MTRPAADRLRDLIAAAVADKVAANPTLLDRASEIMDGDRWRSDHETTWRALVAAGPAAVVGVLTSTHPDTLALKADSPFTLLELIDDSQRRRLLATAYSEPPAAAAEQGRELRELRRDAATLATIVRIVGELQLMGAMTDATAHHLIAAVEGEHRLVIEGDPVAVWPESDLAEIAAELEQLRAETMAKGGDDG